MYLITFLQLLPSTYMVPNRKSPELQIIFAMPGQNQACFAKCYSKLLFVFDWVQKETELYYRFKKIPTDRLHRICGKLPGSYHHANF